MNNNLNEFDRFDGGYNANGHFDWRTLWQGFDWENTRAEVDRDSRGRILIAGLTDAGKSTLLNRLCGWAVSQPSPEKPPVQRMVSEPGREWLEDFGLFCLVDLPEGTPMLDVGYEFPVSELFPLDLAEEADLILYVIDGLVGAQPIDYRWISRIRRLNKPMLIILNKSDMWEGETWRSLAQVEQRLSAAIVPISAAKGSSVIDTLVPKMVNLCPRLAIPLGRELRKFRRQMAERQIRQTALFNSVISLEPVPLLDIPVQLLTLVGMVARIAAVYDQPPSDNYRREVGTAMVGSLAGRYLAQQAVKLVPVVGWLVSGAIGAGSTWLLGQATVIYFESGGDMTLNRYVQQAGQKIRRYQQTWQQTFQRWWPLNRTSSKVSAALSPRSETEDTGGE